MYEKFKNTYLNVLVIFHGSWHTAMEAHGGASQAAINPEISRFKITLTKTCNGPNPSNVCRFPILVTGK